MIKNFLTAAAACAALTAGVAHADTFDFSYAFADGQSINGTFTGTSTNAGQSVSNIANIQVSLNGIAFAPVVVSGTTLGNATLQANAWNTSLASFDNSTPVTIYANGALNNFVISDVDASTNTSPDYEFAYLNDANNGIYQVVAANFLQTDAFSKAEGNATQLAIDAPGSASSWKLTDVSAVPLPAPVLLLASGLGLFGFAGRRRLAL
jgi:hypothetical protein